MGLGPDLKGRWYLTEMSETTERVAAAAILSPGATAQLIESGVGVSLHLAVDRRGEAKSVLLTGEEAQVLLNLLSQYAQQQAANAQTPAEPTDPPTDPGDGQTPQG